MEFYFLLCTRSLFRDISTLLLNCHDSQLRSLEKHLLRDTMNCYGESFLAYPRTNLLEKKKKKRRQPAALFVTLPAHAPYQEIPFLLAQSIILEIRFCHIFISSQFTMLLLPLLFFQLFFTNLSQDISFVAVFSTVFQRAFRCFTWPLCWIVYLEVWASL